VRNTREERNAGRPQRAYRELFRALRDIIAELQTRLTMTANEELLIGLVSISDRASSGVYKDEGIPALEEWFARALASPWRTETRLIPDERPLIESTLADLADRVGCHLVLTTAHGTAPRDVTGRRR